jgi:phosphate/phosphite/phosphonate ABC transporter binding protein
MRKRIILAFFVFIQVTVYAQSLTIATYQYADNNRIANLQPFANYVRDSLGYSVQVKSYPTVHAFLTAIRAGEVDIAFLNTFGYLLLEAGNKAYPMRPVTALQVPANAKDNYKSVLLARKALGITSIKAVKKKAGGLRLALVNIGSTSGNLMPRLALKRAGVDSIEAFFSSTVYTRNHANAIQALVKKDADIAGMGFTEWQKIQVEDRAAADGLQPLWVSEEIPLGPVLFSKSITSAIGGELLNALLQLHKKQPMALESIKAGWSEAKQATHFEPIQANYYDPFVRSIGKPKDVAGILSRFAF